LPKEGAATLTQARSSSTKQGTRKLQQAVSKPNMLAEVTDLRLGGKNKLLIHKHTNGVISCTDKNFKIVAYPKKQSDSKWF
jgi:hypothetical protein